MSVRKTDHENSVKPAVGAVDGGAGSAQRLAAVLESLEQGFFVIDKSGVIQPDVSAVAVKLFGRKLAGENFVVALPGDKSLKKNAQSWLDLAFGGQMDFEDFLPVAPRAFVKDGRRIELTFRPIYSKVDAKSEKDSRGVLQYIICTSADKTEEYNLRIKAESEFTLVQVIMAAISDRAGFVAFVLETKRSCQELLSELSKTTPRIDHIFRCLHSLKGGFSAYYFTELSRTAHLLESDLSKLKDASSSVVLASYSGIRDTVKIMLQKFEGFLKEHETTLGQAQEATDRTKALRVQSIYDMGRLLDSEVGRESILFKQFLTHFIQDEMSALFHRYENVAKGIAERQEKQLELTIVPSEIKVFSEPYLPMIGAYVHVFRNAVDHGIEDPKTRIQAGKKSAGTITISFETQERSSGKEIICIRVVDDGKGIDANIVRKKAIEKGLGDASDIEAMSDSQIIQLLFHTGFSTRDEVSDLSGRGVGLDAVQFEVERLGGRVWVETKSGHGTSVIAEVPLFRSFEEVVVEEDFVSLKKAG